jgi:hypothetical protein
MKKVEQLTAGSDSLCVGRALAAPFMHKRHLYHFPVNCQKAEYVLCRPWERVLSKIPRTQYEVVLKRNRLILLRNLSYRRSVPPPDSRPHSAIFR